MSLARVAWRVHLRSARERVYAVVASDTGRETFLAESSHELDGDLYLRLPNGLKHVGRILEAVPPSRYAFEYVGASVATFDLATDGSGGTDLTLIDEAVAASDLAEVTAGWVSVLMALKAAVDHGVDLRNHDPERSWDQGFADN